MAWQTDDVTAATGSPLAARVGLAGYVSEAQGTQHVFYVSGVDNHIHELWWGPATGGTAPQTSGVPRPQTSGGAATQILNEVAVNSGGQPVNGYHEAPSQGIVTDVECTSPSPAAVSRNIYSCGPTAASADVCWPASDQDLLCMNDPWTKELHRVRARTTPSPVSPKDVPEPVALLLDDGTQCRLRNGGAWSGRDDGYDGAYSCNADGVVLAQGHIEPIDRSAPAWTVKTGELGPPGTSLPPPSTHSVVTAWFARN